MNMEKKNRLLWVEISQIFSMSIVVLYHSIPRGNEINKIFLLLANSLQYPALAVFFLTSGMFAVNYNKTSYIHYIKKRAIRLLIPFFAVNLLMLLPKYIVARIAGENMSMGLGSFLYSFIDPHGKGICPHLWFLPTLFIMSLFVPTIKKIKKTSEFVFIEFAFLVVTFIPWEFTTVLCLNELRLYTAYFVAGFYLSTLLKNIKNNFSESKRLQIFFVSFILSVLILVFNFALGNFFRPLITITGLVAIIMLSSIIDSKSLILKKIFSGKTFIIYILSLCIQNFVEVLALKLDFSWVEAFLLMFLIGILVPYLIYLIIAYIDEKMKLPIWLKAIVGM